MMAPTEVTSPASTTAVKIALRDLSVRYLDTIALAPTSLNVSAGTVHALIGPAAGGKTSLLRTINGMSAELDGATVSGAIWVDRMDVVGLAGPELAALRRRIGIVFATPQPLPRSVFENVAYGPSIAGVRDPDALRATVERSLRAAELWDEVRDRLAAPATALSGGQQQRLCLARTLALDPEVVLLDEPCSGLDPISTARIESTLRSLTPRLTVVFVTNNVKQAERIADDVSFFLGGHLIESGPAVQVFERPRDPRTRDYLAGRFG